MEAIERLIAIKDAAPQFDKDTLAKGIEDIFKRTLSGNRYARELDDLRGVGRSLGFEMSEAPAEKAFQEWNHLRPDAGLSNTTHGFTARDIGRQMIWVRPEMPVDAKVYTLAHELGHAVTPQFMRMFFWRGVQEDEALAESVGYMVLKELAPTLSTEVTGAYMKNIVGNPPAEYLRSYASVYRELAWQILGMAKVLPLAA